MTGVQSSSHERARNLTRIPTAKELAEFADFLTGCVIREKNYLLGCSLEYEYVFDITWNLKKRLCNMDSFPVFVGYLEQHDREDIELMISVRLRIRIISAINKLHRNGDIWVWKPWQSPIICNGVFQLSFTKLNVHNLSELHDTRKVFQDTFEKSRFFDESLSLVSL